MSVCNAPKDKHILGGLFEMWCDEVYLKCGVTRWILNYRSEQGSRRAHHGMGQQIKKGDTISPHPSYRP